MIQINDDKCVGCGICVCLCPVDNCLTGWNEIKVAETCIGCLKCVHGCPVNAISELPAAMGNNGAAI